MVMGIGPGKSTTALGRLSPEQLQRATFDAMRAVFARLVAHGPTVLVLEDLHWADPTSLRLTEELCSVAKEGPLLLVLTRRPEPDPGVSALEAALGADPGLGLRRLELTPLAEEAERDLAIALLGRGTGDEVLNAVCHGTEGNPLFLEERFSSLVETGALARYETAWHLDRDLSGEVPEALERLFRSRLDRLTIGAHDAIVAASVLGPEFGVGALRAVTDLNGDLASAVSELCSGGLLVELRKEPEPSYRFRHSLIQEATYKALLREQRQRLHARAAWGLEEQWAGRLEELAGTLGHHFAMAGEPGRAVHYLEQAGDYAASAFANEEAVSSYRYALDILGNERGDSIGPGGNTTIKAEIELRLKLASVLVHIGRFVEAREILQKGLRVLGTGDEDLAARLYNRLAKGGARRP